MSRFSSTPRTDFGPPPPGYVPGLGRGAVGFTTRSDIGPARPAADTEPTLPEPGTGPAGPSAGPAGRGRGTPAPPGFPGGPKPAGAGGEAEADYSDATFDEFSGFQEKNLFAGGQYDDEDKEADAIFEAIDARMDDRRKKRREEEEKKRMLEYRKTRPVISELFASHKRNLSTMSETDWNSIPEPLDLSRHNKIRKKAAEKAREKLTRAPDTLAVMGRVSYGNAVDIKDQFMGGVSTPLGVATPITTERDLTQLSAASQQVLQLRLDALGDSVSGQTVVDPKGYLTDLNSIKTSNVDQVSDIKRAQLLVKSLLSTNPNHPPAWLTAIRLEEETGKVGTARKISLDACRHCPKSEDVWLECARLHPPAEARRVIVDAVKAIPTSVKLWLAARDLEQSIELRKAVLRKALELIPNSEKLWKAAIEQETETDARIMLERAVECVPDCADMWLALARLSSYNDAKTVLNRARAALPKEPAIWIAAAKLEESNGNVHNVDNIIQACLKAMKQYGVTIERDHWLTEAENAEKSKPPSLATCQSLVRHTIGMGVEEVDQRNTWTEDAKTFLSRGSIETARATYAHLLSTFPGKRSIWLEAAQLERHHGTFETLDALLERACKFCPSAEELWLMRAKEKWVHDDVAGAREILTAAFNANPDSEDIWLAAVKLESETNEFERARTLLDRARQTTKTARVWMKSVLLERQLDNEPKQEQLLIEATERFPAEPKLWMMLGQLYSLKTPPLLDKAHDAFRRGLKHCPLSVDLWLCEANLDVKFGAFSKARSVLETARLKIPKNPKLWLAAIRVEQRAQIEQSQKQSQQDAQQHGKMGEQLLAKALQECPDSGILWAHAIASESRPQRKSRSYDALKKCGDNAHVFVAVAKLFWLERKLKPARDWFARAVTLDPDLGDAWIYYFKFEQQHGENSHLENVRKKCAEAAPRHGELWIKISKNPRNKTTLKPVEILALGAEAVKDHFPLFFD